MNLPGFQYWLPNIYLIESHLKILAVTLVLSISTFAASANPSNLVGSGLLWAGDFGRGIWTVDPSTGATVERLDISVGSPVINDLAFDANSGLLYGISGRNLYGTPNTLFTIDLTSPSLPVRLLGTIPTPTPGANSISGLAFLGGNLIASEWTGISLTDHILTINLQNLFYSNVLSITSPRTHNIEDLASVGQNLIVAGLQAQPTGIFYINLTPGVATNTVTPSVYNAQFGLAYSSNRNRFYTTDSNKMYGKLTH